MITDYQIEMLNVGDADAFVVYYITDRTRKHLVLIDAGRYEDGGKVLEHLNAHYQGIQVELAIVTHPDDDHYGGFVYLLEQIKSKNKDAAAIQRFWVNDPRKHIKVDDVEAGTEAADVVDTADFEKTDRCLSKVLDDAPDDDSDHNRSSLIVLFEPEYKVRFLFTGDASVDSFEHMTSTHQLKCKDLRWLKVPHHGSKHNLNSKWIKYFNPSIAYISTLKRGQYLNQCVVNALKKNGSDVISTHNNPTFLYIVHNNCLKRSLKAVKYC